MMQADRIPVLISTGQVTQKEEEIFTALDLASQAANIAIDPIPEVREMIQQVWMVNILSHHVGPAPARKLAMRLGITPKTCLTTTIGGSTPQWLVGLAAEQIARGETDVVLIAGAEAMHSSRLIRQMHARGEEVPNSAASSSKDGESDVRLEPDSVIGEDKSGVSDAEAAIGLIAPVHIYAMFESILAAKSGRTYQQHRDELAKLLAPFSRVAAGNRFAWFNQARSAAEIGVPSSENRVVCEPYTKLMSAFLGVDQGAALLVTSLAVAKELKKQDEVVFIWAASNCNDVWFPLARPDLSVSPAIKAAGKAVLDAAGISLGDISFIDLYSCFPSAIQISANALGIPLHDPRGLSVTGGLPYFGGPGNNYVTHSIATMAERIREKGGLGLVTGLGWYITKHSIGIYGDRPPPRDFSIGDTTAAQAEINATAQPITMGFLDTGAKDPENIPGADATVIASTVLYDNTSTVTGAPVYARLDDGSHLAATAFADDLPELAGRNLVGARIHVEGQPPTYKLL